MMRELGRGKNLLSVEGDPRYTVAGWSKGPLASAGHLGGNADELRPRVWVIGAGYRARLWAVGGLSVSTSDHTTDRDGQAGGGMAGARRDPYSEHSYGYSDGSADFRPVSEPDLDIRAHFTRQDAALPLQGALAETIENVIIPRLQLNFGVDTVSVAEAVLAGRTLDRDTVSGFCHLVVGADSRDAFRFVEILLERGVTIEAILLDLMAPAARVMGELWESDLCSFVDVTVGLSRIQQITRQIRPLTGGNVDVLDPKGSLLLAPAPGEQHTFGLKIVEEFFLRDGWDVDCLLRAGAGDIAAAVANKPYDIIGLTLGGQRLLEPLRSAITLARYHSLNRSIKVIIGGVGLADYPDLMTLVEADACVADVNDAVMRANSWVSKPATS